MKSPYDVVYTVLITEKGTNLADKYNKYLFKVNPKAIKLKSSQPLKKFSQM